MISCLQQNNDLKKAAAKGGEEDGIVSSNIMSLSYESNRNYYKEFFNHLKEDPRFLLRCALTHNWDVLVEFCQFLGKWVGGE